MEWPTLILTLLSEIPPPAPSQSPMIDPSMIPTLTPTPPPTLGPSVAPTPVVTTGAESAGNAATGTPDWLPLWTAAIGAVAGIGGSALSQVISGKNESKRRKEQNIREDALRRRDELRLIYSDLVRNLDEYMLTIHRFKTAKPIIQTLAELSHDTPGLENLLTKHDDLSEKRVVLSAVIISLLGTLDLLGEKPVFDAGYAYFGFIKDLDPTDETATARGQKLNADLKAAMRTSLAAESPTPGKGS